MGGRVGDISRKICEILNWLWCRYVCFSLTQSKYSCLYARERVFKFSVEFILFLDQNRRVFFMNTVKLTLRGLEKIFWCHKIITPAASIQVWLIYHFECSGYIACTAADVAGGSVLVNVGIEFDVCLSVHCCICVENKNQLDVTECFIALMIRSTCFGHFYAHHQELESICVLLPPMVCSAWLLVVRGQMQGSRL